MRRLTTESVEPANQNNTMTPGIRFILSVMHFRVALTKDGAQLIYFFMASNFLIAPNTDKLLACKKIIFSPP